MQINSKEAFGLVYEAGIVTKYTTFMKMVREGRVVGKMVCKKKGYRFKEQEVKDFIRRYNQDDSFNAKATIESLEEENEQLQKQLDMPKDYWVLENKRLKEQLDLAEKKLEQIIQERDKLKNKKMETTVDASSRAAQPSPQFNGISVQFNNKNLAI